MPQPVFNPAPGRALDPDKGRMYQGGAIVLGAFFSAMVALLLISALYLTVAPVEPLWRWWRFTLSVIAFLVLTVGIYIRKRRLHGATPRRFQVDVVRSETKNGEALRHVQWKPFDSILGPPERWWLAFFYDVGDALVEMWIKFRKGPIVPPIEQPPPFSAPPPFPGWRDPADSSDRGGPSSDFDGPPPSDRTFGRWWWR